MAFTVREFRDLIRILEEHPAWREELRRHVLTDELLALPQVVSDLAAEVRALVESLRQTQTEVRALAEGQQQLRAEMQALAEGQRQLQAEMRALAEAQRHTEEEVRTLAKDQSDMRRTLDRFTKVVGYTAEGRMAVYLRRWLAQRGCEVLEPVASLALDGETEIDGVTRIKAPDDTVRWVLVSAKTKVWPRDIEDFALALRSTRVRDLLKANGITGSVVSYVFGMTMDRRAPQRAREEGVGLLLDEQDEIVPAVVWTLE